MKKAVCILASCLLALLPAGTAVPEGDDARRTWMAGIPGVLELTHNHGAC